ncbi:Transcriptional adapter 2-alpha [Operophtera brumata]|uniref:Transcriptional adapter 2-alpha n=1 Tax=Operophtera brumata TaxID=104452 RepID=A0A0L7L711_OPEBR|nr:Transcriptional adapter 2-alpha [Operophtera brumata]
MANINDILQVKCDFCGEIAHEPYIECCECETSLCTGCFASGQETATHRNDHKYAIRRNDFPLFDNCNWSAKEECKLLCALSTYGYGNWEEISKTVHTRSKLECQEHYKKYYIESVQYNELKLLPDTEQSMFPKPVTPFLYSTEVSLNPPRNNSADQHLAGYNAYRSEFELSYDHNAESLFNFENSYSDDEDDECMDALKVSLVSTLNTRLKERKRRYTILQHHGLIMPNKLASWIQKFDKTLTRQKAEKLLSFMQFMTGMQFDAFIESLDLEEEITQNIARLCEYRRNGIKTLYAATLYKQLKKENDLVVKHQKYATSMMSKKFESQSPIKNAHMFGKTSNLLKYKRTSMPLDIVDLPGFNKLSESERVLCSNLRLLPENYLEIKEQLISQNSKIGFLRLLDARRIVKIDVNKTRKIYDYLLYEGFITKPL